MFGQMTASDPAIVTTVNGTFCVSDSMDPEVDSPDSDQDVDETLPETDEEVGEEERGAFNHF